MTLAQQYNALLITTVLYERSEENFDKLESFEKSNAIVISKVASISGWSHHSIIFKDGSIFGQSVLYRDQIGYCTVFQD